MTIASWILLGAIIISTGLLIVSYVIKQSIIQKICECLIIPLFGALNILFLADSLPDSLHVIKITIAALSFVTISTIFIAFEKYRILRILGRIIVLANVLCWISLYRSIFYIHKVPVWFIIVMVSVYIAALFTTIILSGKQEILFYGLFALSFALTSYLHFCSMIFLFFERSANGLLLFCGASMFIILNAFHFINQAKLNFKHAGVIRYSLLVVSQVLIACSNILMCR